MQERASTTRKAVLRAAAEAFETHGLVSTSINDIIRAAGVTKGALYFHFPSKEALAQAVIAEQSNWRDAQDLDGVVGLQRLIDLSFRFADSLRCDVFVRASIRLTLEYGSFATDHAESYTEWIDAVRDGLQIGPRRRRTRGGTRPGPVQPATGRRGHRTATAVRGHHEPSRPPHPDGDDVGDPHSRDGHSGDCSEASVRERQTPSGLTASHVRASR